jgi:pyridoxamine 5'-phosphate oxidase
MNGDALTALDQHIWDELKNATVHKSSPFKYLNLSTVAPDNSPDSRFVVLRDVIAEKRLLYIHTDIRSEKVLQIKKNPSVALSAYDESTKVQLRFKGLCKLLHKDSFTEEILQKMSMEAKKLYGLDIPGGTKGAHNIQETATFDADAVLKNFVVLEVRVSEVKWLQLGPAYHSAALFTFKDEKIEQMNWIMP